MAERSADDRGEELQPVAEFKERLQRFRIMCGNPSFRDLERLFGKKMNRPQSRTSIQAKLTGDATPDWAFVETFLGACVEHAGNGQELDLQTWRDAHIQMLAVLAGQAALPASAGDPYRSLEAFGENDAIWFHGRADAVDQVIRALNIPRTAVLLLGPSGSGKSSLVQAGVLPALGAGTLPGSDRWIRISARPRQNLLTELDRASLPGASTSLPDALHERLVGQPVECQLLLVIDQFEELLTPLADPDLERARQDALTQVTAAAGLPRVRLMLVMRDDFYPHLAAQATELRAKISLVDLPASLTSGQIRDIISEPAKTAKLTWDSGLPEQIVNDVLDDYDTGPTGRVPITVLPLLELTLYQVWARRSGARLTRDAYRRVGGVKGALTAWCTAAIGLMSRDEQQCAERVLTALVRPADPERGVPAVRQQVRVDTLRELIGPGTPGGAALSGEAQVDRVLHILTGHRIVATRTLLNTTSLNSDATEELRVPVAELVHDAVIRDWPQLREWVDHDHRFQDWLRRTDERHRHWADHPSDDDLLSGTDLAEGIDWATQRPLPASIAAFLDASRQHQQARAQRARRLNVALAGLLAVVVAVAAVAVWQWRAAVTAQEIALSRQLAAQSTAFLSKDPDLARLLAIRAYRISPTAEAIDALYEADAQPIARHLPGYTGWVSAVAYAPDGRQVAGGSSDGAVWVWNLATGQVRTLTGLTSAVTAVAYSPDGHTVAGGDSLQVRVWDLTTGQSRTLARPEGAGPVRVVAFAPDGHTLANTDNAGVRLWDLASGQSRALSDQAGLASAVAYAPDGRSLASADNVGTLQVWDLGQGTFRRLPNAAGTVNAVAYSPDGQTLAGADSVGTVRLWNLDSGQSRALTGHDGQVSSVAYAPDGYHLASSGTDGTVRLWDLNSGQSRILTKANGQVGAVAYAPDGHTLASADAAGVRVWDLDSGQSQTLTGHTSAVRSVAYAPDGHTLASAAGGAVRPLGRWPSAPFGGNDRTVRVWDLASGRSRIMTSPGPTSSMYGVAYAPDGRSLAGAAIDGAVRVWDLSSGQSRTLTGHAGRPVLALAYAPDGRSLAGAGSDGTVQVWNLASGQSRALTGHDGQVYAVAYSPDGHHLVSGGSDRTVRLWDLDSGRSHVVTDQEGEVYTVAYGPNGHTIASGGSDGTVRVSDLTAGQSRTLKGDTGPVNAVAYAPDGQTIASGGLKTVQVWDLATGQSRTLTDHDGEVLAVAYAPDGNTLAIAGSNKAVRVLASIAPTPDSAIGHICSTVSRDLTVEEHHLYLPHVDPSKPTCPHLPR